MKKTEFTKTAIINSTVKLLKANGKVTIKEISDDAGVNIAAINYHFTDKKSLISVVIRRTISDFKKIADNLVANLAELNTHPEETISARKRGIQQLFQQNGKPDVFNGFRFVL